MKTMRLLFMAALAALPASPLFGADAIKVGEYASLTGKEASFGQYSHNGVALAVEEINARGGVLGRPIELISEDDQSRPGQAATVVQKLISRDQVVAVLGEVASSRSLEAAPICQARKIPMISPASTNPDVTEKGDYIFRVCFTDTFQGRLLADFAAKTLKAKKVAVLKDVKSDYSMGLARNFLAGARALGIETALERDFSGGDKDFKAQLTAIRSSNPDAVFVPAYYTDVGLIIRQARSLGIKVPLFGGDGWESTATPQVAGSAAEGTYFSTHFSVDDQRPEVQEFVKKFKAKYGVPPDAMAALGYDSAAILADALRRAGSTDPAKLRDAIAATKDFAAVTGKITLDERRNASKPAVILEIKGGKFNFLELINP
jgi:branched-chain amino acid transport system substrate-binding protein